MNDGRTWHEFNNDETQLLNGQKVRPVATLSPPALYALVDHFGVEQAGINMLFRHERRGWLRRLRLGLADLLRGAPA